MSTTKKVPENLKGAGCLGLAMSIGLGALAFIVWGIPDWPRIVGWLFAILAALFLILGILSLFGIWLIPRRATKTPKPEANLDAAREISATTLEARSSLKYPNVEGSGGNVESRFGTFIDSRDEHAYRTVKIGGRTWFAENLAYIPHVSPSRIQGGIWVYGYDGSDVGEAKSSSNYKKYGCLYDWETAMKVIPNGWHLPSEEDWHILSQCFGRGAEDGNRMKEVGTGYWRNSHGNADNSSGFSALPGGHRDKEGEFNCEGELATFWSSTEWAGSDEAWDFYLQDISPYVRQNPNKKTSGYSVRCIKN
jgi:uncharacterized protein (TIGR02145 family)